MSSTITTNPAILGKGIVKLRWAENRVTFAVDTNSYMLIRQVIYEMERGGGVSEISLADGLRFKISRGHLSIRRQVGFDDNVIIGDIDSGDILPELKNIAQSLKDW